MRPLVFFINSFVFRGSTSEPHFRGAPESRVAALRLIDRLDPLGHQGQASPLAKMHMSGARRVGGS